MNFKPQTKTLNNGLRLVTLVMPQTEAVTALLMVKVGSRYEDENVAGISHFLEHLVFKGTKKYPTALDLSTTVDSIGAEFNAFTSKEYTGFYVKSAANHLDLALDVLSQIVWYPLLPSTEIKKEKGVITEEINMREDIPMAKVGEEFEALTYGLTPLGRQTIGFKKTVRNIRRKDFVAYRKIWYRPERMVLGIVGGEKKTKADQLIKKYFSSPHSRSAKAKEVKKLKFDQSQPQLKIQYKKTEQAHFCLGVRTFPRGHKDRYVMAVLSTILGGNMSSRLFTQVREERGLAYYIKSNVRFYFDNGYLFSQAGTDINKLGETIKVVLKVMAAVKKELTSTELRRAKEYLKGSLALSLEDSKEVASLLVEDLLLENQIRTPSEIIKGIEKVTLVELKRVARKIFVNQGLNLALIGPYKSKGEFAKILKL